MHPGPDDKKAADGAGDIAHPDQDEEQDEDVEDDHDVEDDEEDEREPIERSHPNDPWTVEQKAAGGRPIEDDRGHQGWQRIDGVCEYPSSQFEDEDD